MPHSVPGPDPSCHSISRRGEVPMMWSCCPHEQRSSLLASQGSAASCRWPAPVPEASRAPDHPSGVNSEPESGPEIQQWPPSGCCTMEDQYQAWLGKAPLRIPCPQWSSSGQPRDVVHLTPLRYVAVGGQTHLSVFSSTESEAGTVVAQMAA